MRRDTDILCKPDSVSTFFKRKEKIQKRLRKIRGLQHDIQGMRAAQRKLVKKRPKLAEYVNSEDFV